jgi:hypothetical protein
METSNVHLLDLTTNSGENETIAPLAGIEPAAWSNKCIKFTIDVSIIIELV